MRARGDHSGEVPPRLPEGEQVVPNHVVPGAAALVVVRPDVAAEVRERPGRMILPDDHVGEVDRRPLITRRRHHWGAQELDRAVGAIVLPGIGEPADERGVDGARVEPAMLLLERHPGQELDRAVQPVGEVVRDSLVERPRVLGEKGGQTQHRLIHGGASVGREPLTSPTLGGSDRRDGGAVDDWVRLALRETAEGRWFTDPARTVGDLAAVELMLDAVWHHMRGTAVWAGSFVHAGHESDGRAHRAIVCDAYRLSDGRDLAWVGFFAAKRRDVDGAPLTVRDDGADPGVSRASGNPSYSSLGSATGTAPGNLILLDGDEAREHWRVSERHAHAARELAPRHYTDVRLHQGTLPGGLRTGRKPVLRRTKYYDYRDAVVWRAEREWLR